MKTKPFLAVNLAIMLIHLGCSDVEEVNLDEEWSNLRIVARVLEKKEFDGIEVVTWEPYQILCVDRKDASEKVWILLNSTTDPLYKQIPQSDYYITSRELNIVLQHSDPTPHVLEILKSHLIYTDQDSSGNPDKPDPRP